MKKREFIKKGLLAGGGLGLLGATSMLSTVPAHANTSAISFAPEDLVAENFTVPSWTLYKRALHKGLSNAIAESFLIPKERPFNIVASINGDPSSSMGITWYTNAGQTGQYLEYVEGDGSDNFCGSVTRIDSIEETTINGVCYNNGRNNDLTGIFANNEKRNYVSHKALLTGLRADTLYTYRVGKEGHFRIGSFRTAKSDKSEFEFIYITDTQSMNEEYFNYPARTVATAHTTVPNAAFLLCAGDLVESAGSADSPNNSEWEWEQWFERMQDTWLKLPVVPVQGNHDTAPSHNMFHHFNTAKSFTAYHNSSAKTADAMDGTVYSFVCGDALFMVLNFEDWARTESDYLGNFANEQYFKELESWMENQVRSNPNAKWRIVAFHKAIFTGDSTHQDDWDGYVVRNRMSKVFERLGIDLALQGHGHVYEVMGVILTKEMTHNLSGILMPEPLSRPESVPGAITEQNKGAEVPPNKTTGYTPNVTGKEGGTFNVQKGMVYFLNNSAGKKKYTPCTMGQMANNENEHRVSSYYNMFSKLGQTGEPAFSRVRISTSAINIDTYTVDEKGVASIFDTIKIVRNGNKEIIHKDAVASLEFINEGNRKVRIKAPEDVVNVSMYAFTGTQVISQQSNLLDLSGIDTGTYLLNIQTVSGVYTEQFIVTA
jgi:3',5'-cyclic AMP phosphodiesterase CpdA